MKKIIYLLTVVAVITIAACKQDKCDGVVCQNGGTCNDGVCQCNSAFTGANCETHTNGCDTIAPRCLNGGTCANGICTCAPHYFGDSCLQQEAPLHMYITGVTVNSFSPASQAGVLWDADGSGADIYPIIKRNGSIIFNGHTDYPTYCYKVDANYSTGYSMPFFEDSIDITDPTNPNYRLELWDYDNSSDSTMMEGRNFVPYTGINGFPGSITVNDTSAYHEKFEFRVNLSPYYKW